MQKKKNENPIAYFSYCEYAWAIAIFCNGFNNWIVDVIWHRVAVSIFCNLSLLTIF